MNPLGVKLLHRLAAEHLGASINSKHAQATASIIDNQSTIRDHTYLLWSCEACAREAHCRRHQSAHGTVNSLFAPVMHLNFRISRSAPTGSLLSTAVCAGYPSQSPENVPGIVYRLHGCKMECM
jgi:hypothetical protein